MEFSFDPRVEKRRKARRDGAEGEVLAAAYLQEKGYEVLEANFHHVHREIDLVVQNDACVAFVEVKTRSEDAILEAPLAVDRRKQMFLFSAASRFLAERPAGNREVRFDIVWVESDEVGNKRIVEYIEGAFAPFGG